MPLWMILLGQTAGAPVGMVPGRCPIRPWLGPPCTSFGFLSCRVLTPWRAKGPQAVTYSVQGLSNVVSMGAPHSAWSG